MHLETVIHIGAIDGRPPPRVKRRLGIWLRLDLWALVSFLYRIDSSNPDAFSRKEPFQVGKISTFEESVLQDTLDTTQRGNHVNTIVVELPELSIMAMRSPPEGVAVTDMELANNKLKP